MAHTEATPAHTAAVEPTPRAAEHMVPITFLRHDFPGQAVRLRQFKVAQCDSWTRFQRNIKKTWLAGGLEPSTHTPFSWKTYLTTWHNGVRERFTVEKKTWNTVKFLVTSLLSMLGENDTWSFVTVIQTRSWASVAAAATGYADALTKGLHYPDSEELTKELPPPYPYDVSLAVQPPPSYAEVLRMDEEAPAERERRGWRRRLWDWVGEIPDPTYDASGMMIPII